MSQCRQQVKRELLLMRAAMSNMSISLGKALQKIKTSPRTPTNHSHSSQVAMSSSKKVYKRGDEQGQRVQAYRKI